MAIAAGLAAGLLGLGSAPAQADGGSDAPPRPGLKPLLLEPLVWDEACEPAHTRVDLPIGRMSAKMRETWGLLRTADPAHWSPGALLLLGRAYETGELGLPDPGEAARLYCLLLRHHGSRMGAEMLSRLHARGDGVAFSPTLADHFARISALHSRHSSGSGSVMAILRLEPPTAFDEAAAARLQDAQAWWHAQSTVPKRLLDQRIGRYRVGTGVPRSALLADALHENLVRRVLAGTGHGAVLFDYLTYKIARRGLIPELNGSDAAWLQMIAYEAAAGRKYPPAQAMLGRLYLIGRLFPRSDLLAFLWLHVAQKSGADVSVSLAMLQGKLPHAEVRGVHRFLEMDLLPPLIFRTDQLEDLRALLMR